MDGFDDVESNRPRQLASTSVFQLVVSLHFILALFILILLLVGHSVGVPSPSFITLLVLESVIAFVGLCALSYNSLKLRLVYILLNVLTSIAAITWAFYLFIIPNDQQYYKAFIMIFLFILQFGMAGIAAFLGHKPLPDFCRRSQILMTLSTLPSESQVQVIKRNASDRIHESKSSIAKKMRKTKSEGKISSKESTQKTSSSATSEARSKDRTTRDSFNATRRKMMREIGSNESIYGNASQDTSKGNLPSSRKRSSSVSTFNNATKNNTQGHGSTQSLLSSLASSLSMIPTGISRFISDGKTKLKTEENKTKKKNESETSHETTKQTASITTESRATAGKGLSFDEIKSMINTNHYTSSDNTHNDIFTSITKSKSEHDIPSSFYAPPMPYLMSIPSENHRRSRFRVKTFLMRRKQHRASKMRSFSPLERNIFKDCTNIIQSNEASLHK